MKTSALRSLPRVLAMKPTTQIPTEAKRAGALFLLLSLAACSGSSSPNPPVAQAATVPPDFGAAVFSDPLTLDHPLLPFEIGLARTFVVHAEDTYETLVVERLDAVRVVAGVPCAVVRDRVWEEGLLIEDTLDWYAQDDAGNVWYMGEEVDNYEYDDDGVLIGFDHDGSWEAGLDVAGVGQPAQPGYALPATPQPGDLYFQEYYPGEAEDMGRVVALDVPVMLADGRTLLCLQTEDYTPLEPGVSEYKYYAPGIGAVREEKVGGSETLEWLGSFAPGEDAVPDVAAATFSSPTAVDNPFAPFPAETSELYFGESEDGAEILVVERLDETRVVMGIECIVVRDRVFQEELLVEDTRDWYAQDDAGNVWYMGEEVDNYEYDDDGELLGIDHEGSWEAGLDILGAGSVAQPGYQMAASPAVGDVYHQEFYADEAEDMALVVATDVVVELADGSVLEGCLQTLEWNPLAPEAVEFKYFAPGLGLVLEETPGPEEALERVATFARGPAALPDVSVASFSAPSSITHDLLQYVVGESRTYVAETEDGPEAILIDILSLTRVVMGIECRVVQDRVFLDGLLIEDTFDWYAQDDAGNVWYMGEEVDNYEYDDDGRLVGIDHDGSWEAGQDINGAGTIAEPGHHLPSAPAVGSAYFQEFYEGEAEDMALVVDTSVFVELSSGDSFEGCVQTLEWNPLDPGALEHKFYAPGVGLVLETKFGSDEQVELQGTGR